MTKIKIRLDTITDAQELVKIASRFPGAVTITDGSGLRVSAKSLMGALYSLEFSELWLEMDGEHFMAFSKFEVGEEIIDE